MMHGGRVKCTIFSEQFKHVKFRMPPGIVKSFNRIWNIWRLNIKPGLLIIIDSNKSWIFLGFPVLFPGVGLKKNI